MKIKSDGGHHVLSNKLIVREIFFCLTTAAAATRSPAKLGAVYSCSCRPRDHVS